MPKYKGKFTLHNCILSEDLEGIAALLADNSVDVNKPNSKNQTPMHLAALSGRQDILNMLKKSGAKPNVKNAHGSSPLHIAVSRNDIESVKFIINMGARLNDLDRYGNTPLHLAAYHNYDEAVQELLNKGAHPNLLNKNWATPLSIALSNNRADIVQIIKAAGGKTPRSIISTIGACYSSANYFRKYLVVTYSLLTIGVTSVGTLMTEGDLFIALVASIFSSLGLAIICFNAPYQRVRNLEAKVLNGSISQSEADYLLFGRKPKSQRKDSAHSAFLEAHNDNFGFRNKPLNNNELSQSS